MKLVISLWILLVGSLSFAGDAGCGLGSMIISKNSKLLQLFAVTTNHSFWSQEFGITSGTSGCSASGIVMNDKETQYFVEVNQQDLTRQMAQGQGEKLDTLGVLQGCKTPEARVAFAKSTQASFSQIVTKDDIAATEFVQNLKQVTQANSELGKVCQFASL